jgi:hypothetical protein
MFTTVALLALALASIASAKGYHYHAPKAPKYSAPKLYTSPTYVHGYTRKNGTYVMPHYQTAPNATRLDNWSTKGNVNPYTGTVGTKDPYAPPSSGG